MHLNLIECGSKLPADLSIFRLAHGQARPAGCGPGDARRHVLPSRAGRVFFNLARRLPCVFENVFITKARQRQSIHP